MIAGRNIDNCCMDSWRSSCGVVMQDGIIFTDTIARNIAVGDGDVDISRLSYAARVANIHNFISGLPLGYNTIIGPEGRSLSLGQKQRILLARVVYKNPHYIFLDEATNALDSRNERDIILRLEEFFKGKTVVIIAHRLSTVKNADNIIVVNDGKVIEQGNHRTHTKAKGEYYNLVKNQLELGV